jgi:hypothetical protein
MLHFTYRVSFIFFMLVFSQAVSVSAEKVSTSWGGSAEMVYDTGFMHKLMRAPDGGVRLFNMDLVENDAPGSGRSELGVYSDTVWGKNRARKIFTLDDPRTEKAWIVIFVYNGFTNQNTPKHPLRFSVNGNEGRIEPWDFKKVIECYRWVEFPSSWLKRGDNIIDFYCPEITAEAEGWELHLARAEDFPAGGGDPARVGETSFKSFNDGKTWEKSAFGPDKKVRAEYTIRLSLDRYEKSGWLASPVIDLWKGDSRDFIVPQREIKKMKLTIESEVPEGTKVEYYFRKGSNPQPFASEWGEYQFIGSGPSLAFETGGADLNRRYIQFKAVLSTTNPLRSPVVKSALVEAELEQRVPKFKNISVIRAENPAIKYSSIEWEWEPWDRPEFQEIRKRENLDEVVAGCRTSFDAQVKILDYVSRRWQWMVVSDNYPSWAGLSILDRIENRGWGGMCALFNNLIGGMCMAYGWQARMVNIVGHEVIEVWNDEYGKWVMLDGAFDPENGNTYQYDPRTAEPLNMSELHRHYLDYYFPARPIDWMQDFTGYMEVKSDTPAPVGRGSLVPKADAKHTGFITAGFMRLVPRNNWYEKPTPRPLAHGTTWWPWDGYINWYDARTPPKRQYSWYTDRERDMWPELNLVHVDATQGLGNDRLFLRFETYTPNFCHFEVNADDTGWKEVGERWTWLLQSGRNTLRVRAVNKLGAKGKPSSFVVNHADAPFGE